MSVLFYLAYCFRRLYRADRLKGGSRPYLANVLLVVVVLRLLTLAVDSTVPRVLDLAAGNYWDIVALLVLGAPIYLIVEDERRYQLYAGNFRNWPKWRRILADIAVALAGVLAIVGPLILHFARTGRTWR